MSKLWILAVIAACTPQTSAPPPAGPRPPAPTPAPAPSPEPTPTPDPSPTPEPAPSPVSGPICGTRGASPCPPTMFCNFTPGARCGIADAPGHCAKKPEACAQIYKPVCGCDGKTYGNACTANASGVGVMSDGECAKPAP